MSAMLGTLRAYLAILAVFIRTSLQAELAFRVNLVVNIVLALVGIANAIAGVAVIFSHTSNLRGWTFAQTLVLLGVYTIVNGLLNVFVAPNLDQLSQSIRQGNLDFMLLKPASSQFLVSFQRCVVWGLSDVLLGVGVLARVSGEGRLGVGPVLLFGLTLAAGVVVLYSFWIMLATFAFWFVRIDNLTTLLHTFFNMGRFPVDAYPTWLRRVLTFVIPVALVPAISVAVAVAMVWLSTRL